MIIDIEQAAELPVPDIGAVRELWDGETTVNGQRPDPYVQALEWLDADRLRLRIQWEGEAVSYAGELVYRMSDQKIVELSLLESGA